MTMTDEERETLLAQLEADKVAVFNDLRRVVNAHWGQRSMFMISDAVKELQCHIDAAIIADPIAGGEQARAILVARNDTQQLMTQTAGQKPQ